MLRHRLRATPLLVLLVGCSGSPMQAVPDEDDTELPDLNARLSGTFHGSFRSELIESENAVLALAGTMTLQLGESDDGGLFGVFDLEGTVSDDQLQAPVAGSGTVFGSVSSGQAAILSFSATPAACPGRSAVFSGSFDRRVALMQIEGPIIIFDQLCTVIVTFPTTIWLGL